MLFISQDEYGITTYTVTNDYGLCLIRTTDARIANYVNYHSYRAPAAARLAIGGDVGHPELGIIWRFPRKVNK
jgi:hypothetical protein